MRYWKPIFLSLSLSACAPLPEISRDTPTTPPSPEQTRTLPSPEIQRPLPLPKPIIKPKKLPKKPPKKPPKKVKPIAQPVTHNKDTYKAYWYGLSNHGQRTESGEIYDLYAKTAAHPTFPLGRYIKVTEPKSKRSVILRINDRQDNDLRLSYQSARELGLRRLGQTVKVRLLRSNVD